MPVLVKHPELQPASEMPVWARLLFTEMIPRTYSHDTSAQRPRYAREAVITGFHRTGDTVWIHYTLTWPESGELTYIWSAVKSGREEDTEYV